jgi:hypothetical protein
MHIMEKRMKLRWWGMGVWVIVAAPAYGQSKVIQEPDRTVYRKRTTIDFSDVAVEGQLSKPEGSYVLNRKQTSFRNLIRIRDNFLPELQKSVDSL